jgi:drug/metabolite transporter (DMT)-like permease
MHWLGWASIVGVTDVIYHMGFKAAADKYNVLLYMLVMNGAICLLCLAGLAYQRFGQGQELHFSTNLLWLGAGLGVVVGLMELAIFKTYAGGAPFTLANPFMGAMVFLVTFLVAWFYYGERLDWISYTGLGLMVGGNLILAYRFAD